MTAESAMFGTHMAELGLGHAELLLAATPIDTLNTDTVMFIALAAEVNRLREASAVTAVNFGKAQAEIAQLQTKLARIEDGVRRIVVSLSRRVTPSGHALEPRMREMFSVICSELNAALSDPQPSAAPTPKGEPYNGY
jgi:hypothetical protein